MLSALLVAPVQAAERHCVAPDHLDVAFDVSGALAERSAFGPNFVTIGDASAVAQSACVLQKLAQQRLFDIVEELHRSTGLDPQIAVVLTTETLACGDLFYVSIANDIQGIGYRHQDPRDIFDDSPNSRLEGIAFLNDWPYWQRNAEEFAKAFNHEIAHRWGARIHAQKAGVESDGLLGRQQLHWSYFVDTGGSPLEGNAWTATDLGTFRAETPFALRGFSNLDLYLMGLVSAAEVPPWHSITPSTQGTDCLNSAVQATSPPQSCGPLELAGDLEAQSIDAVIAVEGARVPSTEDAPRSLDVAVFVLESPEDVVTAQSCHRLSQALDERFVDFARATGGRLTLRNVTKFDQSCSQAFPEKNLRDASGSGGCQFIMTTPHPSALTALTLVLIRLLCSVRGGTARRA